MSISTQVLIDYLQAVSDKVAPISVSVLLEVLKKSPESDKRGFFQQLVSRITQSQLGWYKQLIGKGHNQPTFVMVPNEWSDPNFEEVSYKTVLSTNLATALPVMYKNLTALHSSWEDKVASLFSDAASIVGGCCVMCSGRISFPAHIAFTYPPVQWRSMWFFQHTTDCMAGSELAAAKIALGQFWPVLAICHVNSNVCRGRCRGCGEWISQKADFEIISSWCANNAYCYKCLVQGLVTVEHPKLDRKRLREYTQRFSKLGK